METMHNSREDADEISLMWKCFFDERVNGDPEIWFKMVTASLENTMEAGDDVLKIDKEISDGKHKYIYHNGSLIEGYLNTNYVAKIIKGTDKVQMSSPYPEFVSDRITQGIILEIIPYDSGQNGLLKIRVVNGTERKNDPVITFFDTRFTKNVKKYVVGKKYKFRLGALTIGIIHRAKSDIRYKQDGEVIDTSEYSYIYQKPDIISPQFKGVTKFTGLRNGVEKTGVPLKHPIINIVFPKDEMYIYDIKHKSEGKTIYTIPALVTDGVMLISNTHRRGRKNASQNRYYEGDPINMVGILQGFLEE